MPYADSDSRPARDRTRADHKALLASLTPAERRRLCAQSDGPAARRLAVHLGAIAAGGVWIGTGLPGWWALMLPQGIALVFLFTALHECIHRTAFRSDRLNDAAASLLGFLVFLAPTHFRHFHLAHHRYTHDPRHDPELATPKPGTAWQYVVWISGLPDWRWRIATLVRNATGPNRDPFIADRRRQRVKQESRAFLALYGALFGICIISGSALAICIWLAPLLLGGPFLRAYLLAEHGRCPHVADMLRNTRTTLTNRLVRYLAWNMPYHAEHHAYPAVPFHNLPQLHEIARQYTMRVERGYARFNAGYLGAAARDALPDTPGRG